MTSPVGRDAEMTRIEGFFDGVKDGSRTLILTGEVGIGKTTLIRYAEAQGTGKAWHVLRAVTSDATRV